jgi:hypothetical protein
MYVFDGLDANEYILHMCPPLLSCAVQTVADMIVFNRSASLSRGRLANANRKSEPLKLKLKVPHAAAAQLGPLKAAVEEVLYAADTSATLTAVTAAAAATAAGSAAAGSSSAAASGSESDSEGWVPLSRSSSSSSMLLSGDYSGPLLKRGSVEMQLSKFTDAGLELLVKVSHLQQGKPAAGCGCRRQQHCDTCLHASGSV